MTGYVRDVVCYYHEPVKAPLLRAAVLPAVEALAGTAVKAHVERHWLHGPHLRIRVAGDADVDSAAAGLAAILSGHIGRWPSRARLSHDELLSRAAAAGRAELLPPPYEPIEPDNTVRVVAPDTTQLARLLGSSAAVELRATLLRAGLPAVAATMSYLERGADTPSTRVRAAMTAMIANAGGYPLGLRNGYVSYRSHVEDFLHRNDPHGAIRDRFATVWRRHADDVCAAVAAAASRTAESATVWHGWSVDAQRVTGSAYDRGVLRPVLTREYADRARTFGDPRVVDRWNGSTSDLSEFHRALLRRQRRISPREREITAYRFTTNMLYLLLTVCDVTPMERYLAASLVSEAVERMTGQSWREWLGWTGDE